MKILFVPGIKTFFYHYWGWQKDAANSDLFDCSFAKCAYMHWQLRRVEQLTQRVATLIEQQQPDALLAHSFGGIVAKTALSRVKNHSVTTFATMASPHTMQFGGVQTTKDYLQTPDTVEVQNIFTFGGILDPIVPPKFTMLPGSKHVNLPCEHLAFLFSKTIRKQVQTTIV